MLDPLISKRRLRDALARLVAKGLIEKRFDSIIIGTKLPFYYLSRKKLKLEKVRTLMGEGFCKKPNILNPTTIRFPFHWYLCSYLLFLLRKMFPDYAIRRGTRGVDMPADARPPDIIIEVKTFLETETFRIGIYVEFDIESAKMIERRLERHKAHPNFDLLILANEEDEIIQNAEFIRRSRRFRSMPVMFLCLDFIRTNDPLYLHDVNLKSVLFAELLHALRNVNIGHREECGAEAHDSEMSDSRSQFKNEIKILENKNSQCEAPRTELTTPTRLRG